MLLPSIPPGVGGVCRVLENVKKVGQDWRIFVERKVTVFTGAVTTHVLAPFSRSDIDLEVGRSWNSKELELETRPESTPPAREASFKSRRNIEIIEMKRII